MNCLLDRVSIVC